MSDEQPDEPPDVPPECRSYEQAADDLGISRRKVRALTLARYLVRCPGHGQRVLVRSVDLEREWRSSAPAWRRATRPLVFGLQVAIGVVLELL